MTFNRTLSQLADEYFEQAQVLDGIIAKKRKTGNTDAGFPTTDWKLFSNHVKIYTIVNFVSSQTFW